MVRLLVEQQTELGRRNGFEHSAGQTEGGNSDARSLGHTEKGEAVPGL
jgi:hypothetical protein